MKLFILIFGLLSSGSTWAAELVAVRGELSAGCHIEDSILIQGAQERALEKVELRRVQVSKWNSHVGIRRSPYMDETFCSGKFVWAEALFAHPSEVGQVSFLTSEFSFTNPRKHWEVPGDNTHSDEAAWHKSLEENRKYALKFCKSLPQERVISKTKTIFEGRSWYDSYAVKVRFQCEL
ncbi:hypothetical protein D3C87_1186190 [compost metagenome]